MAERVFLLPDVGEGLVEAEIVTWKVAVGDTVALNQPVVDIVTAKATVELPSPFAGTVVALHGAEGDLMDVGQPLMVFDVPDDAKAPMSDPAAPAPDARTNVLVGYGVANEDAIPSKRHRRSSVLAPAPSAVATTVAPAVGMNAPRSTPPVRLYAKQRGIDLATVAGTGRDGLITRDDVERALGGEATPQARVGRPMTGPTTTSRFAGREIESWATGAQEERIAVKGVLRSMSEAMVASAFSAPQASAWTRLDATRTVELLDSLKRRPSLSHVRLSPLTIVALAFCDAARHYPGINSSFDSEAGEVIVRRTVNLGIAADTPRGLVVPNIKGADQLDLESMAGALNDLVDRARAGLTTPNEMLKTTLTITNVGPFGVDGAIAILPPGTGAILAVGRIAKAPWVVGDEVVVRHVLEITLSFDHRQIDGALASSVLAHVARFLEDPASALLAG